MTSKRDVRINGLPLIIQWTVFGTTGWSGLIVHIPVATAAGTAPEPVTDPITVAPNVPEVNQMLRPAMPSLVQVNIHCHDGNSR